MKPSIYTLFYYLVARRMPKSTFPVLGKLAFRMRGWCCRNMFAQCGVSLNVEQGAYVGDGSSIRVGNHVGIGKDCTIHNRFLTIDDGLMMGEEVLILGGGMSSQIKTRQLLNRATCQRLSCISAEMFGLVRAQSFFRVASGLGTAQLLGQERW